MSSSSSRILDIARHARTLVEAAGECVRAAVRPMSRRERVVLVEGALSPMPSRALADSPRIVVDGVFFQLHDTGISRVWKALMARWSETGFASHVVVLDRLGTAPRMDGFTYREMIPFRYHHSVAQSVALEAVCRAERADLFISTYYTTPLTTRSVMYVYDMIPEVQGFDLRQRPWREKRTAARRASAYIAISESTARDLHRLYPATEARPLLVAHNGVDAMFKPSSEAEIEQFLLDMGLPRRYFVVVGARDVPYKNASLVFDAIALLPAGERPAVLFVGGRAELEPEFARRAEGFAARVAALSDAQLTTAYSGAAGLIYPSKYEGFGLPILEAMACGCPVVTCRNSSIPEVADDAARYVDEDDPSELAAAMTSLGDPAVRETWRARGFAQVQRFDWAKTADAVERFLCDVAGTTPRVP